MRGDRGKSIDDTTYEKKKSAREGKELHFLRKMQKKGAERKKRAGKSLTWAGRATEGKKSC